MPKLLTDPFLQLPTDQTVNVVWFTEFEGTKHIVVANDQTFEAVTRKMSRLAEDIHSFAPSTFREMTPRHIWRHEAVVTNLTPGERIPYHVISTTKDDQTVRSETFTLSPLPQAGQPLKILLTSDHQLKPMVATNLQKVVETIGQVDAVFMAGDLVNVADRASQWFDDTRGLAFFPCLQGYANKILTETTYRGGQIIQHAPLFPAIGNHEVMGKYSPAINLNLQFEHAHPRAVAEMRYEMYAHLFNPPNDPCLREEWIRDNSFNTTTYEEIFTLPQKHYYSIQFGDIYLIVLYAAHLWRTPDLSDHISGRYREADHELNHPDNWGYGDFPFGEIGKGSAQYNWLQEQLQSSEFRKATYKVVMLHHPFHSLGGNAIPVYTPPQQIIERDQSGKVKNIRYEYPIDQDILVNDIEPLLEAARVDLVHFGHAHLWNRFRGSSGINYLETSNVGNSYGCYWKNGNIRKSVPDDPRYNSANYPAIGDPHELEPIFPTIIHPTGENYPGVASNDVTVFSILDTQQGTVSSYYFDTRQPDSEVIKFDEFDLK